MLEKKEIEILNAHKELINSIVNSRASSFIPNDLIQVTKIICKRDHVEFCSYCPGTLYRALKYIKTLLDALEKPKKKNKSDDKNGREK